MIKIAQPHQGVFSKELVGGKGFELLRLKNWGINVPDFLVILTDQDHLINQIESTESWGRIKSIIASWNTEIVSVRSSVNLEDNKDSSFAGLFETFLNVSIEEVPIFLKKMKDSLTSSRVKEYCQQKKINKELKLAIVVQKMLQPEKSGVIFSRAPLEPTGEIHIDVGLGLGEGIVSGTADVESVRVSRDFKIIKSSKLLIEKEIKELAQVVLKLEAQAQYPVDVEWSIEENELYILQMRPITQGFKEILFLDDTNLTESYPGLVSPLTASFVKRAYRNVFLESAILFGASQKRILELLPHYEGLIECVQHHLYYNIKHYYAILSVMPGGDKNIDQWHAMIGGETHQSNFDVKMSPISPIEKIISIYSLIKMALFRHQLLNRFCDKQDALREEKYAQINLQNDPQVLSQELIYLLETPSGFGLTLINDVFIMIGLGFLKKLMLKNNIPEESLPLLLKTHDNLTSLAPIEKIQELKNKLQPEILVILKNNPQLSILEIHKKLKDAGFGEWAQLFKKFMDEFGDRTFQELILESKSLKDDMPLFINLLQMPESKIQKNNQKSLDIKLNYFFKSTLNWTRNSIFWREKTRLKRGQYYNLIRAIIDKIWIQLSDNVHFHGLNRIDFFTLNRETIKSYAENKMNAQELSNSIKQFKDWKKENWNFPSHLIIARDEKPQVVEETLLKKGDLKGMVASMGLVEGIPLCVSNPEEVLHLKDLNQYILVTRTTDPAWVYLMSQCKGLISEKGSLLSHTAIIGRELGIPTLVGVPNAFSALKNVKRITLDAYKGIVHVD